MTIVPLKLDELVEFCAHLERGMHESGKDGLPQSHPYLPHTIAGRFDEKKRDSMRDHYGRALTQPGWRRGWLLRDGDRTVGHVDLHGGEPESRLHRATVGLGIERAYIRQGHGGRLMSTAIQWARDQKLAWLDLGVFGGNHPAHQLYVKLGFAETGRTPDLFRIGDQSIEDIQMSLRLG